MLDIAAMYDRMAKRAAEREAKHKLRLSFRAGDDIHNPRQSVGLVFAEPLPSSGMKS
jgi:hypothetical protein